MTKTRSTKRALLLSALSLLMCVSMLVGSTFAWFTDSVTSSGNKIQSGKLELDLELLSIDDNTTWTSLRDNPQPLFNYNKWEPGYTEIKILKIENEGTLALKWMAKFISEQKLSILADVIDVYVKPSESALTYPADRNLDGYTRVGTVADFVNTIETTTKGSLEPKKEAYLGIALKMQETAGNKYQELDLGGTFDIQILATQYTYEDDSFDKLYDQFADYDGEISTPAALIAAFTNGGTYKLLNNIALDETATVPAGVSVNLDLGNNKLSIATVKGDGALFNNKGSLTIVGGTLENTATNGDAVINNSGTMLLDDVTVIGAPIGTESGKWPEYALTSSGDLTIEDGTTITSDRGAISLIGTGTTVINGGSFTSNDININWSFTSHVVAVSSSSKQDITINDGTFQHLYDETSGGVDVCNMSASTVKINGGTFNGGHYFAGQHNLSDYGFGMTKTPFAVTGGTFDTISSKYIAEGYTTLKNADGTYTVIEGVAVANQTALENAIANNASTVVLSSGNYTMPEPDLRGKTLNIIGDKDTVVDVSKVDARDQFVTGATIAFDGVTLNFGKTNYMGFANTKSLTYKNCAINGLQFLFGENVVFENCVFNSNDAEHSVWTYGAKNISFTDCDFTYGDRAVNVYLDNGTGSVTLSFNKCTFTTTNTASKGGVEINSSAFPQGANVSFVDCTAPDYGTMVGISGWDGANGANATVTVDGAAFTPTQWAK